jgi:integrase
MRINEICQLRIDDVYKDGKHYVFNIIESEDTKLKTNSSERIIPVHPILIKLGFHDYVRTLKELGKGRIFWELSKKRDGYSSKVSDWFNGKYLKSIGVHVPRKKVFHSFRHTMSGLLQKNGVRKEVIEGFVGHTHHSMSLDRYGDRFSTEVLWKEVINKISFDGVKWEDLKIDWKQRIHP